LKSFLYFFQRRYHSLLDINLLSKKYIGGSKWVGNGRCSYKTDSALWIKGSRLICREIGWYALVIAGYACTTDRNFFKIRYVIDPSVDLNLERGLSSTVALYIHV
jgi:hypothetical protein